LERAQENQNILRAFTLLRRGSLRFSATLQSEGWFAQRASESYNLET
jgi:hypothetical protein